MCALDIGGDTDHGALARVRVDVHARFFRSAEPCLHTAGRTCEMGTRVRVEAKKDPTLSHPLTVLDNSNFAFASWLISSSFLILLLLSIVCVGLID